MLRLLPNDPVVAVVVVTSGYLVGSDSPFLYNFGGSHSVTQTVYLTQRVCRLIIIKCTSAGAGVICGDRV